MTLSTADRKEKDGLPGKILLITGRLAEAQVLAAVRPCGRSGGRYRYSRLPHPRAAALRLSPRLRPHPHSRSLYRRLPGGRAPSGHKDPPRSRERSGPEDGSAPARTWPRLGQIELSINSSCFEAKRTGLPANAINSLSRHRSIGL